MKQAGSARGTRAAGCFQVCTGFIGMRTHRGYASGNLFEPTGKLKSCRPLAVCLAVSPQPLSSNVCINSTEAASQRGEERTSPLATISTVSESRVRASRRAMISKISRDIRNIGVGMLHRGCSTERCVDLV